MAQRGRKPKPTEHSIYQFIVYDPNLEMASFVFRETLIGHSYNKER